jgi:hypothetical protein
MERAGKLTRSPSNARDILPYMTSRSSLRVEAIDRNSSTDSNSRALYKWSSLFIGKSYE